MLDRLFVAMRAALFGTAFVGFWGWAALWMRRIDSTSGAAAPSHSPLIGAVVLATGAMLALASIAAFVVRGRGTPAPFDPPRVFVATGPYRFIRNPMYVGGWLALVGLGIVEHSAAMVAFSIAWLGLAHAFVVGYEERTLAERFGGDYLDYCRRVPRWLPVTRRRSLRRS
jgi:protein-S-isoprenylcysteine O-methyltransferase Ste14